MQQNYNLKRLGESFSKQILLFQEHFCNYKKQLSAENFFFNTWITQVQSPRGPAGPPPVLKPSDVYQKYTKCLYSQAHIQVSKVWWSGKYFDVCFV